MARVSHSPELLKVIGLLIIRAVENEDLASILVKLEEAKNADIAKLAEVLERWGIGEVANISSTVQQRIKVLNAFANLIHDPKTLELQHLHKSLENNLWIIDERLTVFSSNQNFRNIAKKLASKFIDEATNERPDLIIKGFLNDYVIIELKRPSVKIIYNHMTQLLSYRDEFEKHVSGQREISCYMVGLEFDKRVLKNWPPDNDQKAYCLPLGTMVDHANERLNWLKENIEQEIDQVQTLNEILKDLGLESVGIKK